MTQESALNKEALVKLQSKIAGQSSSGLSSSQEALLLKLECRDMAAQLTVSGFPESAYPAEILRETMIKLSAELKAPLALDDIVKVERMGRKKKDRSRTILLELKTRAKCVELIGGKKEHPNITVRPIDDQHAATKSYINHRWPMQLHQLRARILERFPTLPPKLVWIADAAVWLRKDASARPLKPVAQEKQCTACL